MQTICESAEDALKAIAEVRKMYPNTTAEEFNKVYVPMARYADANWNQLPEVVRDAYGELHTFMMTPQPELAGQPS